jgi:radical SAM protein with 4Fe4S-binding SPASM domain
MKSDGQYEIPNIKTHKLLDAINSSKLFMDMRKATVALLPENCASCTKALACSHGCRTQAYLSSKNWSGSYPYCNYEEVTP